MAKYLGKYTGVEMDLRLEGICGGIHTHGNALAQSIPSGAVYEKVVNFTDNDIGLNTVPDFTNNQITVNESGAYRIEGSFSFLSGTNNITAFGSVFVDGVELESAHFSRKISTAADVGNAGLTTLVNLTAGQIIDFRVRHSSGSAVNMTFSYMNLNLTREG